MHPALKKIFLQTIFVTCFSQAYKIFNIATHTHKITQSYLSCCHYMHQPQKKQKQKQLCIDFAFLASHVNLPAVTRSPSPTTINRQVHTQYKKGPTYKNISYSVPPSLHYFCFT